MHAAPPTAVLTRYGAAVRGLSWAPVGGGFSGASVWRGDDAAGTPRVALKAWPTEVPPERVAQVHAWLAQAGHVPEVPGLTRANDGNTLLVSGGRVWDCAQWKPGTPRERPTVPEVESAFAAIARLHSAWQPVRAAPCPGVLNRLRVLGDFRTHFGDGLGLLPPVAAPLGSLLRRARDAVARLHPWATRVLRSWEEVPLPLRACVRDLRGEHVLFTGTTVTGVVDYGAMAVDHVAVDLARLLGDFAWEDDERFSAGMNAYRLAGGEVPEELVRVLTKTVVPCSVVGWLVRLLIERRSFANETAVADRLLGLVERAELFAP